MRIVSDYRLLYSCFPINQIRLNISIRNYCLFLWILGNKTWHLFSLCFCLNFSIVQLQIHPDHTQRWHTTCIRRCLIGEAAQHCCYFGVWSAGKSLSFELLACYIQVAAMYKCLAFGAAKLYAKHTQKTLVNMGELFAGFMVTGLCFLLLSCGSVCFHFCIMCCWQASSPVPVSAII